MSRKRHGTKSNRERALYTSSLRQRPAQPTVEEELDFELTDDGELDYSLPDTPTDRPREAKFRIRDHFRKYWIQWTFSVAGLVVLIFISDFYTSLARLEERSQQAEKRMDRLNERNENSRMEIDSLKTRIIQIETYLKIRFGF